MDRLIVEGGHALSGTVVPSGNKNEALPILAASLLTDEEVVLKNIPAIGDTEAIMEILHDVGVEVRRTGAQEVTLQAGHVRRTDLDPELCQRIRGSIILAGPMLARCGRVRLPRPGGDRIGRRRVDTHILALSALGAEVEAGGFYTMEAPQRLRGQDILLDETSVTATESTIMAAVVAEGTTIIRNAASEPHVQELCKFLNAIGADISGIGTNTLTITGVKQLRGGTHEITTDYIEVGSFICLAAATDSEITIKNARPEYLRMILLTLNRLGIEVEVRGEDVFVPRGQRLEILSDVHGAIPKIDDHPWPGFPADLICITLVVATQAEGTILIFDKMFESRLYFVDNLITMGAKIVLCDPHRAVIVGPSRLQARELFVPDIRAGMALLIAAMCAEGTSVIQNIGQIDRGYERIDERLRALGARIERVS